MNEKQQYKQPNHEINEQHKKMGHDYLGHRYPDPYREEYSADLIDRDIGTTATSGATIAGFVGLAATIFALFNYSFALGVVGVALGCYAVAKGAKTLGIIAIGIGLFAVVFHLFYSGPFISLF